ncbi:ChrR family anti-sigma-E factor [Pseudogemmobacter faecipullorum]|uniref:Cupin domain-containing protein n=1 Tax=Pseudogemmobacter faecipullorum TaxID=2755041 RepID=A0ABS8CR37_9RHOB|nr:ChrR family anti-sigma-E factor [Pseudogemmobacter faecipullorum]MCB5411630.1 cupin domain-containing protein [Pseudogemmobacter faecipullorum]
MTTITHHISDDLLDAHVTGNLPHAFSVVVAAHLSLCDACRARAEAAEMLGGALLDRVNPRAMSPGAKDRLLAALDDTPPPPAAIARSGIFPAPVMQALDGQPPKWRMLGGGIRQQILSADREGSLRLLYIPAGRAVPEHSHGGLELTLVLQGSFSDSEGRFGVGDVETAGDEVDHQPVAGMEGPCICLAATDAPLRFRAMIPRLLQPLFRI